MSKPSFAEYLQQGVIVFDGAMGTEIYRHHVFTNRCFDELNLSDSKLIEKIHQSYCAAGAEVLTTNTFGANRETLSKYGLAEQVAAINRAGAQIARKVADRAERLVFVAGSVGPLPTRSLSEAEFCPLLWEQVDALMEGGADFIIFETQPSRRAVEMCVAAMRGRPQIPFVISLAVYEDGETASGESVQRIFAPLADDAPQPIAWGLNCGSGPHGLLFAVEQAIRLVNRPLIVQPNAGIPKEVEHRRIYLCSPEYLAEYGKRYVNLGVAAVGGCCGTTPDHIRALCDAVKPLVRARVKPVAVTTEPVELKTPIPLQERSRFAWRLVHHQWVTSVELVPPRGFNLQDIIEKSKLLHRHGVDAINIPDGPRASSRISPLITADRIQREAMIEVILHFCCRDRNLIGMQADLLACAACDIRNILFITGDPPKLGNYPHATGVFDTDSIGMVAVQKRLNQGVDLGGQPIDPPTAAVIGVGLDPTAIDQKRELDRFRQKVEAGAEFAITQPVFDPEALLNFLDKVQHFGIPIIAGVWPLASLRNATFLKNEVPGVVIPDWVMDKMASVSSREDQLKMGIEIAQLSIAKIRDRVAGIQVSAPFGRVGIALEVIGVGLPE
ncbi:MAG: bifunctional homocysteine S-methyltransferase/methylenetetrahydrofolate reductase [Thermogutta sp.]